MPWQIPDQLIHTLTAKQSLSEHEVRSVARIAYLASEIDLDEDAAEGDLLETIEAQLWRVTGLPPEPFEPVSPLPIDGEERQVTILQLAAGLSSAAARELAYVLSYLLTVVDLELAPIEVTFLDDLQDTLDITDDRAADLVAIAAEAITPGVSDGELSRAVRGTDAHQR